MERERITISIKKDVLAGIDKTIDGTNIRNRSHAIETLVNSALNVNRIEDVVILLGGENALKMIPSVIENILTLKKLGLKKVFIAAGYLSDKIKQKIGPAEEYSLKIEYIDGEGSGGALNKLKKRFKSTFAVIEPTATFSDLESLLTFHKEHFATATLFTNDLNKFNGIYLFEPDIFRYIPVDFSMLNEDIFPKLVKDGKLIVSPIL